MAATTPVTLLLIADARFPAGGHAHSGGLEAAAELELVRDVESLELFLRGRLATAGLVTASFAAAACRPGDPGDVLDPELDARMPSPALRRASRRLGRQLLRAGRRLWPCPALDALAAKPGHGPHHAIALGAVGHGAGLRPDDAALAGAYDAVTGPATAAVRLLGLDPFAVHARLAALESEIASTAADAVRHARGSPSELPANAGPLLDLSAERHATWEVRLFAS